MLCNPDEAHPRVHLLALNCLHMTLSGMACLPSMVVVIPSQFGSIVKQLSDGNCSRAESSLAQYVLTGNSCSCIRHFKSGKRLMVKRAKKQRPHAIAQRSKCPRSMGTGVPVSQQTSSSANRAAIAFKGMCASDTTRQHQKQCHQNCGFELECIKCKSVASTDSKAFRSRHDTHTTLLVKPHPCATIN